MSTRKPSTMLLGTPSMSQVKARAGQATMDAKRTARTSGEFGKKFQNDWTLHLSQALAF